MFQLSLIFSHFLVKLFALRQLTQTLMLGLILLLMASGEESSFFDVRGFNPGAPSNHPFKSAYRRHEREKRRQYEQRVREVEHGHFTLLVFTTTGEWVMLPAKYRSDWPIN